MSTNNLSAKSINRNWEVVDAKNQILGRLATEIATKLMGKNKPNFVTYLDNGDNVVVINASKVVITGKKEQQKKYVRHSGFPGGLKVEILKDVRADKPETMITHAVKGMLPKSKLGRQMIKKLHVFASSEHSFKDKIKGDKVNAE